MTNKKGRKDVKRQVSGRKPAPKSQRRVEMTSTSLVEDTPISNRELSFLALNDFAFCVFPVVTWMNFSRFELRG